MLRPPRTVRQLPNDRRGLAGLEFALLAPLLLTLLAGLADGALALSMSRRLGQASEAVAEIATTLALRPDRTNALTAQDAWRATTAPFAYFPTWYSPGQPGTFAITLTDVEFTAAANACGAGCNLAAQTRWTIGNASGAIALRPCGTLTPVPNGSASTPATLPVGVFGTESVLVADVSQTFAPVFSTLFIAPFRMTRSAYASPRIGTGIPISGTGPGRLVTCS